MFCYKITNKINNKSYIGITIDFDKRIKQHQNQKTNSLIHKAIVKYGKDNFDYQILDKDLSLDEAEALEIKMIRELNTLSPNGYNLAKGGMFGGTKSKISDEQIAYIKNNRNIPMYILYENFSELISYEYFKSIYNNKIRTDIQPTVDPYPKNLEFSTQFIKTKMTYYDIVEIRKAYANMVDWEELFDKYSHKVAKTTFFDIYRGQQFKLVMPEVFSEENKRKHSSLSHSGEKNANSKLTKNDVKTIRELHKKGKTNKEISKLYPQVSLYTISDIIRYKTWKNI